MLGLRCSHGLTLRQAGPLCGCGVLASSCGGFSCCGAWTVGHVGFRSCGPRAQLLQGMWDLPRPGIEPASPALQGRLPTTGLLGKVKVTQSCPTLCNPMDYTVRGILQARILESVAIPFSRGSSQPRDQTQVSPITGGFFTS